MLRKNLILPEDLKARRRILEEELDSVIGELVIKDLSAELTEMLTQAGYKGQATLSWEFYSEYDDEGGYDKRATSFSLTVDGIYIDDLEEINYMCTYTYHDGKKETYEANLHDHVSDMMYQYNDDLYSQGFYGVTVDLG